MEYTEDADTIRCVGCGRASSKDELIQENGESIEGHLDEIKQDLKKDVAKQINDMLTSTFKGSKNLRIK